MLPTASWMSVCEKTLPLAMSDSMNRIFRMFFYTISGREDASRWGLSVCQHVPKVADARFRIPFVVECPASGKSVILWIARCLVEIVVKPAAVAALTYAAPIVNAEAPRTWIENLVCVSV